MFDQLNVPRTAIATDNPVLFDDGRAAMEFYTPSNKYFGRQIIPVGNRWSDGTRSFMAPVAHYHLLQTETFHVESGRGLWYLKGKTIERSAGQDITIPKYTWHTFENHPDSAEPLVILYRYDSQRFIMEESFFRNTLTYLWDCGRAGVEPSVLQLSVFIVAAWMPADFVQCPGDYLSCFVNTLAMWMFAFIGRFVYGYKSTYPEYWDEEYIRTRIGEESKKAA
ncbi:uncharacterized protein LTR77_008581 [Saxophila tyrrhenica]|uniref:Cupin type-2 domain-containing protein n=1 Tax=Saxophila tyrrhenica TaxID=1690608 RepID=A0AAV9P466_9PEZI|nr:hypothetical protein LTR77_008581 [Saxophila tyrrhenica]